MKILLDECVDRRLAGEVAGHQANVDFDIGVVVMRAASNRLTDLRVLVPDLQEALPATKPGQVIWVGT